MVFIRIFNGKSGSTHIKNIWLWLYYWLGNDWNWTDNNPTKNHSDNNNWIAKRQPIGSNFHCGCHTISYERATSMKINDTHRVSEGERCNHNVISHFHFISLTIKPFALQLFYDECYVCMCLPTPCVFTDGVEIVLLCVTHAYDNKNQCVRSIDIYKSKCSMQGYAVLWTKAKQKECGERKQAKPLPSQVVQRNLFP